MNLSEIEKTLADWKSEPVHQPDFEWRQEVEWLIRKVYSLQGKVDTLTKALRNQETMTHLYADERNELRDALKNVQAYFQKTGWLKNTVIGITVDKVLE